MLFRVRGKVNQNGEVSTFGPTVDADTALQAIGKVRTSLVEQGIADTQITNIRADVAEAGSLVKLRVSEADKPKTSAKTGGKPAAGGKK